MTGVVIQARMGSTRLPGKVLKSLAGIAILEHIVHRASLVAQQVQIVVATTDQVQDNVILQFCRERNTKVFRGSENHVLERYVQCARHYSFDHVVRLTADNPFVDVEEIDRLILLHFESNSDYTSSFRNLPVGVGAEIFLFSALERSLKKGVLPHHVEHVNEYILEHPDEFTIAELTIPSAKKRPDTRLTVDTPEDFRKAAFICEQAPYPVSTLEAIKLSEQFEMICAR
ncbi:MAG: glycosyltransferase family protein [Chitinophagaceae bacterium]|nr:glycosyltransferase family protein [Chitinophagaceae bacterium]